MFEPYRRDAASKALFQIAGLMVGASLVTLWLPTAIAMIIPIFAKLAMGVIVVILFLAAYFLCPPKPPGKEDEK